MPYILLTAVGPPDLRMANCLIAVPSWSTSPSRPSPHSLTQLTWCSGASWAPTFSEERSLSLQDEVSYALLGAQIAPFLPHYSLPRPHGHCLSDCPSSSLDPGLLEGRDCICLLGSSIPSSDIVTSTQRMPSGCPGWGCVHFWNMG